MGKKKVIRHLGMTMTDQEHRKWHRERADRELTPQEHHQLMERLDIRKKEDEKWHQGHDQPCGPEDTHVPQTDPVNPFAIGGRFLTYCVGKGWLIQQGRRRKTKHYIIEAGHEALAEFGIVKY